MLKDPIIRRFLSGTLFASAFVWVAVYFFEVDMEVIWVFLALSVVFVLAMIVIGLLLVPVIRLFSPKATMLSKLKEELDGELNGDTGPTTTSPPTDRVP